jgi:ParB-like chromosome segregation protein Spo0J
MRYSAQRFGLILASLSLIAVSGCGPGPDKRLAEADARIQALAEKGIPDSILSDARIKVSMGRGALKAPGSAAAQAADSAIVLVTAAEKWYQQVMQTLGAEIAATKKALGEQTSKLTGPQLRVANAIIAEADSLAKIPWLFQARQKLAKLEKTMPQLLADEAKAVALRPQVIGTWRETAVNPDGDDFKSVRKSTYVFKPDGKLEVQEEKKGQTAPSLKEDWKFASWGTWTLKGDTIQLAIEREKCERQVYTTLVRKDGKESWETKPGPVYDSTVTGGKKDRTYVFADLKSDMKKAGK